MLKQYFVALASGLALVSAYHAPTDQLVNTNPIYLPNEANGVTVGTPFTVTWDGNGLGEKVSLLLWRGPGTNLYFLKAIGDAIPNTGKYVWTPDASLEDDITRYGLQVVSEVDGKFQWSTQFGVSNKNPPKVSSSAVAPSSSKPAGPSVKPTSKAREPPTSTNKPWSPPTDGPKWDYHGGDDSYKGGSGSGSGYGGSGSGSWSPPKNDSKPSVSTTYVPAPKATGYTGPYSNNAGSLAFSAVSAVVALGATILLL